MYHISHLFCTPGTKTNFFTSTKDEKDLTNKQSIFNIVCFSLIKLFSIDLFVCQNNCEMNECNNPLTTTSTFNLKIPLTMGNINLQQERVTVSPKKCNEKLLRAFQFLRWSLWFCSKGPLSSIAIKVSNFRFEKLLVLSSHYNFELTAEQPSILRKHFQTFQTSSQSTLRRWITITGDSCLVYFSH